MFRLINLIRERVNLKIYRSKEAVLKLARVISMLASFAGILTLIFFYGFPQDELTKNISLFIIKGVFFIFILSYLTRIFYSFHPFQFIISTWFEGLLVVLLIYDGISLYLFGVPLLQNVFKRLGMDTFTNLYVIFIQLYMLVMIILDLAKASRFIAQVNLKPSATFILSFLILIFFGAGLLMLPEMTTAYGSMPFIDAVFTSTSAVCVTGLLTVDVSTAFTFKGQMVILFLIQLGGLGIISFASFFASFISGGGMGIKQASIIGDFLSIESQFNTKSILRQIVITTITIEIIGTMAMYFLWNPSIEFNSIGDKIFYSIFHSVSAFCNAGISTLKDGLYHPDVRISYMLHLAFIIVMVLGGIGFPVIADLFSVNKLRERLRYPWLQWEVGTKIAIYTSLCLILFPSIFYFYLEYNNTLKGMDTGEKIITTIFQISTPRTCGFNTVDTGKICTPILIVIMFLMFVGGSSSSIAGGIKTSTLFLMLLSAYTTVRGKKQLEAFRRNISLDLLHKAFTVFGFATSYLFIVIFLFSIIEPTIDVFDLAFETFSAFGTVGLSTGITSGLTSGGKILIIITMFIGRVSTLSLFYALSTTAPVYRHKYPEANIIIG